LNGKFDKKFLNLKLNHFEPTVFKFNFPSVLFSYGGELCIPMDDKLKDGEFNLVIFGHNGKFDVQKDICKVFHFGKNLF